MGRGTGKYCREGAKGDRGRSQSPYMQSAAKPEVLTDVQFDEMRKENKMEENMVIAPNEEIGVEELEENLTSEAEQQQEEENDEWIAGIRQGLGELFEDGWTTGELDAMTQDEAVQREIADGHGVVRAACGYLKRMLAAPKKGMVPIARTTAAGTVRPGSRIEQMSDREFAAFSKRAQEAMMAGRKVRVE